MSRDVYGGGGGAGGGVVGGSGRSPRPTRRDISAPADPYYQEGPPRPHSPSSAARRSRSATRAISPTMAMDPHSSYMDPHGPPLEADRRSGSAPGSHHRSRSQSRTNPGRNLHSLDRDPHNREFMPIRDPRDRSMERGGPAGLGLDRGPGFDRGPGMDRGGPLDRGGLDRGPGPGALDMHSMGHYKRDRSLDRGGLMEDDLYRDPHGMPGRARTSPNHAGYGPGIGRTGDPYLLELQMENAEMQKELGNLKKELEHTNRKLGTSMHSIKTFWSPELKKERALRKEESSKYSLINDQLKLFNQENQKQAMLVRQLEEELRHAKMKGPSSDVQTQMDALLTENEHLSRESNILRETIKELELRIETQKQTLSARDESIKKLLEMLQQKGMGKDEERAMLQQMQGVFQKQLEEARQEIQRRDQEILALSAKMKTLEEQHQDYTRHIMVLKESLIAKEEHYNMLQTDVEELRQRLEEKNKTIEKKTQQALQATQERNRLTNEANELRDHMDIKDRKINVLQRKLDLHDAMQGGRTAEEIQQAKKHVEEQMRNIDQRQKSLENRNRQLDERERTLGDLETRLHKKKEQLDNLETQLTQVSHGEGIPTPEANKQLNEMRKALGDQENMLEALTREKKKLEEDLRGTQSETERLLQVMRMGQEEQFAKDNTIKELQEALKRGGRGVSPGPSPSMQQLAGATLQQVPQDQSRPPSATPSSKLDGIAAPLSGAVPANLAATAGKATASAQEAAKATLEQAKNVAQPLQNAASGFTGLMKSFF